MRVEAEIFSGISHSDNNQMVLSVAHYESIENENRAGHLRQ